MKQPTKQDSPRSDAEVHLYEGVRFGHAREFENAVKSFRSVIELSPNSPDGYFNLALALRNLGELEDSIDAYQKAIALQPNWAEAYFNLGNAYKDAGRPDKAIEALKTATQVRPSYTRALNNLANLYLDQGNITKSEEVIRRAIDIAPDYAEARFNLGRVLQQMNKSRQALDETTKAVQINPSSRRYRRKLAELQQIVGDRKNACDGLERLVSETGDIQAVIQLAQLLRAQNQIDQALAILNKAVFQKQYNAELLWLRGDLRRLAGNFDDALDDVNMAIQLDSTSAPAFNLKGVIYYAKGMPFEAIGAYEEAIRLRPDLAEAHSNLSAAYQAVRRYDESLASINASLALKSDFAVAHLNRALNYLRAGEFAEGWREFEWRFVTSEYRMTTHSSPRWIGEDLTGKTILLRSEQGLGDTFQFIRYAQLIKQKKASVIVECQNAAVDLVATCPGVDGVVKRGEPQPKIDVHLPMMSLPMVFETSLDSVPNETPYLFADQAHIDSWTNRIRPLGKFKIGIAWQGSKKYLGDSLRSLELKHFRPLAEVSGVTLISLQKNDGSDQLNSDLEFSVTAFTDELDASGPFRDTAALIMACDLIVTSDTAIAHLAGALGKSVWVALSYSPDWRWLSEGSDSPWYPTMRCFRQREFGDWPGVFSQIANSLKKLTSGKTSELIANKQKTKISLEIVTSPGELIDKITILEIKLARIQESSKLMNIRRELDALDAVRKRCLAPSEHLQQLTDELGTVNEELWDIEDKIRLCERSQDFGQSFIELARSVYLKNDRRAELKRNINELLQASFFEEKSYVSYQEERDQQAADTMQRPKFWRLASANFHNADSPATAYLVEARLTAAEITKSNVWNSCRSHAGIVIGHFDDPSFLELNLRLIRKHCGRVPVLVADDCSPGANTSPHMHSFANILQIVARDGASCIWTGNSRIGHVGGDLTALAKGLLWGGEMGFNVLFKISQRLIIDVPNWLDEAIREFEHSEDSLLGRGCTHFGWKIRTESAGYRLPAWNSDEVLLELLQPGTAQFAEDVVANLNDLHFAGKIKEWSLLSPSRQQPTVGVYFRSTHTSQDYARLADSIGLKCGVYRCSPTETRADYQR